MQSNYKRLGDYIRQVDVRNRDLAVDNLLGLSISKQFIPSIANTIGTDMANYKIVQPRQFGYVPVTSRNGDKITIAIYEGDKPCIISQAYIVFEVTDSEKLLPEYLMMWFRRPEFDRYARFKSHGSAREVFEWEEMCDVMLPVPPIVEQRKIVAEYQAIERRIENNRRLIATLEATAQTIYRHMFVDNIDPNNLPQGWRMGKMKDIASFAYGRMPKEKDNGVIPVFSGYGVVGYCNEAMYDKQHIIVIARGDSGSGKIVKSPKIFFLSNLAIAIKLNNELYRDFLYYHLRSLDTSILRTGSAQAQVTISSIEEFEIIIPPIDLCSKFYAIIEIFNTFNQAIHSEKCTLMKITTLSSAKLSNL